MSRIGEKLLRIREKLGQYQEVYFMIFMLAMTGMTSMGINSENGIYKIVFAIGILLLLLKMAVTNFTLREILLMAVITVLLGCNLLKNGEKTLILTAMGIFGAKNISVEKLLRYALWIKGTLVFGTMVLAATGIIENAVKNLPKNGERYEIYCYGYPHPNMAFANIFVVLLLAILVYGDKLKWYAYGIGILIMLAAYKLLMCRTGLIVWLALCLMVLGYRLARHWKWERIYMGLFTLIPVVLAVLTLILPVGMRAGLSVVKTMDVYLTGRIRHISQFFDSVGMSVLGCVPREPFDSMYFHLLYNYGWILFALCLVAYCFAMWYCNKKGNYYGTIGLGIMAVYGFMEHLSLSVLWNLPLLYLSLVLFRERKVKNEQLQ